MVTTIIGGVVGAGMGFMLGHYFGRAAEQKAVAAVLMEFGRTDAAAKSLVTRCYTRLSVGIKTELKKLGL